MPGNSMEILDAMIRGAGSGAALLFGLLLLRRGTGDLVVRYGLLFCLGVASYLICSALWFPALPFPVRAPVTLFCLVNPLLFWLFARALLDDHRAFDRTDLMVTVGFAALVLLRVGVRSGLLPFLENTSTNLLMVAGLALIMHILFTAVEGRKNDLLESRRRLRVLLVSAIGLYMVIVLTTEFILSGDEPGFLLALLNAIGISLLAISIAAGCAHASSDLFSIELEQLSDAAAFGPVSDMKDGSPAPRHDALAISLLELVERESIWREPGLTVAALADRLGVREYQLRRTINQDLNYRNFSAFLNKYRLAEIEANLANPEMAGVPVLTLALDAGFNSIGPFNRAFKAAHGVTPTQYRSTHLIL